MKKSILLLVLIGFMSIIFSPQGSASDRDVGYKFTLPVDNAAVVAIDQVVILSPEYVTPVELRDPGDMRVELSAKITGLEAKSPVNITAFPNGDLTYIKSNIRDKHGTRLINRFTRCTNYSRIVSTSNGGAGY
jgi:hypothetical protein